MATPIPPGDARTRDRATVAPRSHALDLPSNLAGFPAYFAKLSGLEQERLLAHRVHHGKAGLPLVNQDGTPNPKFLAARGKDEFFHALWMLFDPTARGKLAGIDPGLLTAEDDRCKVRGNSLASGDLATNPIARVDAEEPVDAEESEVMELFGCDQETARAILDWHEKAMRRKVVKEIKDQIGSIIGWLIGHSNMNVAVGALMYVYELGPTNGFPSQSAYAKFIGLTRQAISKAVRHLTEVLDIPETEWSRHMKSGKACRAYAKVQLERHHSRRPTTAAELDAMAR